jgi:hypothetical protein
MGTISGGLLYRGSYPLSLNDKEKDEAYNKLVSGAGIKCVLNLADNEDDLEIIAALVPWYDKLLEDGNVTGLDIQFDFDFSNEFENEVFRYRLRRGFEFLISREGPYLIHCHAGRDRTGFVAAIIELLFGASLEEVIYDYLLSYGREFADAKNEEQNYLTGQIIYGQINAILNGKIKDRENLQANIEKYFLDDIGLTTEELRTHKKILSR